MSKCKYCIDGICVNADSPTRADYCPVPNEEFICRYEEREEQEKMIDERSTTVNPSHFFEEKEQNIETLTDIMKTANCVLGDALHMAYSINRHLFGIGGPAPEEPFEPKCYRDDLVFHTKRVTMLADELAKIMKGLGMQ